jgi:hypothetical protein
LGFQKQKTLATLNDMKTFDYEKACQPAVRLFWAYAAATLASVLALAL